MSGDEGYRGWHRREPEPYAEIARLTGERDGCRGAQEATARELARVEKERDQFCAGALELEADVIRLTRERDDLREVLKKIWQHAAPETVMLFGGAVAIAGMALVPSDWENADE